MLGYFLSILNIWSSWDLWNSESFILNCFSPLSLIMSLIVFLQQRDIDQRNKEQ